MPKIQDVVDTFFSRYENTLTLLDQFLTEKKNHQEFVLLSCARLDSLANLAFSEGRRFRVAQYLRASAIVVVS